MKKVKHGPRIARPPQTREEKSRVLAEKMTGRSRATASYSQGLINKERAKTFFDPDAKLDNSQVEDLRGLKPKRPKKARGTSRKR